MRNAVVSIGVSLCIIISLAMPVISLSSILADYAPWLVREDFSIAAPQGFGDRHNSWAWGMKWWRGHLYVGTNRAQLCVEQWEFQKLLGPGLGPILFPYPPANPYAECAESPADLPLQAEIWRWTPESDQWDMVYRSPEDVDNPDYPGKKVAYSIGFRTMAVHTEPDGTEALYVGGVTSKPMWDGVVPPPRILRTTDGVNFTPIPQDTETFMGGLPSATFRSLTSYNGQLFAIHGSVAGFGSIIASANPMEGNDAWQKVSPDGLLAIHMQVFNGWLYVGTTDRSNGYSVLKTQATGEPPYTFIPVVEQGGFLAEGPSDEVLSMHVFDDHLFVGTGALLLPVKPTELIRINADDTWEVVVGKPRLTPDGWKFPLSGLQDGFDNGFNDHMWRMQDDSGQLYIGTFDSSTQWGQLPGVFPEVEHLQGFDLYETNAGWYFRPVTLTGFDDPFSVGLRSFEQTPFGLVLGTANPFNGLEIWRATPGAEQALPAPARLEVEESGGRPVLSWKPVQGAARYHIWRASVRTLSLFPKILGGPSIPEKFVEIGATAESLFADQPLSDGSRYHYYVVAEDMQGKMSGPSNIAHVPMITPPVRFGTLNSTIDRLEQRGRFTTPEALEYAYAAVEQSQDLAAAGDFQGALSQLWALRRSVLGGLVVLSPDDTDFEVIIDKLMRRLKLAQLGRAELRSIM